MKILGTRDYDCELFSDCIRMLKSYYSWVQNDELLVSYLDSILSHLDKISESPSFDDDITDTLVLYISE